MLWSFAAIFGVVLVSYALLANVTTKTFTVHSSGVVLITGASSGIGFDAAKALAAKGYTVFGTVRNERDYANLQTVGVKPVVMSVDDEISIQKAFGEIEMWLQEKNDNFVALINNAGISFSMPLEALPLDKARHLFEVNVFGLIRVTQLALPHLRASKGRVINIGSVAGVVAAPFHGIYSASKFAVEALSDALRLEMSPLGVSVSVVEPGYVQTPIVDKGLTEDAPFRHVSQDHKQVYPDFFSAWESRRRGAFSDAPFPNTTTTPAIIDAVSSPTPAARYAVAGVGSLPSWLVIALNSLPTRVRDHIVEASTRR